MNTIHLHHVTSLTITEDIVTDAPSGPYAYTIVKIHGTDFELMIYTDRDKPLKIEDYRSPS